MFKKSLLHHDIIFPPNDSIKIDYQGNEIDIFSKDAVELLPNIEDYTLENLLQSPDLLQPVTPIVQSSPESSINAENIITNLLNQVENEN